MDSLDTIHNITMLKEIRSLEERLHFVFRAYTEQEPDEQTIHALMNEQEVIRHRLDELLEIYGTLVTV